MSLELHVWGPAFGLPSIDAECLAAIIYFKSCLPADTWSVTVSNDVNVSPLRELPALRRGENWVSRFANIVEYVRCMSDGRWYLDQYLTPAQRADCTAFSSLIESRGQPLLDLSLYVSSENYTACTRSALAEIVPWPGSWTVPSQLRDKAKRRSEHLGLSSLDLDVVLSQEREKEKQDKSLTAKIPQSLRIPRQTLSGLLEKNVQRNQFRLEAVTSDFFEPLESLLGEKRYLINDRMTSLDCLAVATLALIEQPTLPSDWLKSTLQNRYPTLAKWAKGLARTFFRGSMPVDAHSRAIDTQHAKQTLRWRPATVPTISEKAIALWEGIVDALPFVPPAQSIIPSEGTPTEWSIHRFERKQMILTHSRERRLFYSNLAGLTVAFGALTGFLIWNGVVRVPKSTPLRPSRRNFGQAGAMLGLV